jgi:hypothetical protein
MPINDVLNTLLKVTSRDIQGWMLSSDVDRPTPPLSDGPGFAVRRYLCSFVGHFCLSVARVSQMETSSTLVRCRYLRERLSPATAAINSTLQFPKCRLTVEVNLCSKSDCQSTVCRMSIHCGPYHAIGKR